MQTNGSPLSSDPPLPEPPSFHSEMRLLPDGRVLVHNLTPAFARFLDSLGLADLRSSSEKTEGAILTVRVHVAPGLHSSHPEAQS
ncbi:MAG: hypothetical protein JNN07_06115 [Verrucomicrobiales bacterium]|nr:hypothetical protein [Verrucomicrobiales bacterium]